jgi:hypothetical protein
MTDNGYPDTPKGFKRVYARSIWHKKLGKRIYPRKGQFFSFLVKDEN